MADIQAFRALRFNLAQVGMLSNVVCPPYDVIDPALQRRLLEMSPLFASSFNPINPVTMNRPIGIPEPPKS